MIKLHNDLLIIIDALIEQIELFKWTKKDLEKRMNINKPKDMKAMAFDSEIRGCRDFTTLDRLEPIYTQVKKNIEDYDIELLKYKEELKKRESELAKCKGIQENIYRLHVIEGMTLQDVADELGKEYQYIKNVNSQIYKSINNDK